MKQREVEEMDDEDELTKPSSSGQTAGDLKKSSKQTLPSFLNRKNLHQSLEGRQKQFLTFSDVTSFVIKIYIV